MENKFDYFFVLFPSCNKMLHVFESNLFLINTVLNNNLIEENINQC